ncbi:MAG: hypothetical protein ACOH2F_09415 [Cellulomonas sp.]
MPGAPRSLRYLLLVSALVLVAASFGLVSEDAYRSVSALTRSTWRAQDVVTLLSVPLLLWTSAHARSGSFTAHVASVGVLTWLTYCYAHQAIGVPFTAMFLVYVAILGLAGFAMIDGLLRVDVVAAAPAFVQAPYRAGFWFLTVASVGITGLWLSDILPALPGGLPANLHLAELPNPTWVLDLAWIIPAAVAGAWMLRRRHPAGPLVAGVMLVMLLILSVAMLTVTPVALVDGLGSDPAVRPQLVAFTAIFTVLGVVEALLLATTQYRLGTGPRLSMRRGWWPAAS